jgi:V8-like Glu-specific endopeptidase
MNVNRSKHNNQSLISFLIILTLFILSLAVVRVETAQASAVDKQSDEGNVTHFSSGNSILWRSRDKKWNPIEHLKLFNRSKDIKVDIDATLVEIYDVKTRNVTRYSDRFMQKYNDSNLLPAFRGLMTSDLEPMYISPPDDRVRITPTTTYPWSSICKLFIMAADGTPFMGTGFIVGSSDGHGYHVLTAAHCVYIHHHGGWVSSVEVVPALDYYYMPYNHALVTDITTYVGWIDDEMWEYDMALLTLDRNVGDYTGWMGIYAAPSSDPVYTGLLNLAGYPGDLDYGYCMYWDADYGMMADEYNHWYYMDMYGGQSGGPVWYYNGINHYVLSINAYSDYNHECSLGTRINFNKFNDIETWCGWDTPPVDYANLIDDGQAYSGFDPVVVLPSETYLTIWSSERNIGTANSGGFNISYYLSTDTEITASDYLVGTVYVDLISPFHYRDSEWSGIFPMGIPNGTYWVGWIIDSADAIPELIDDGENDNTAYKDTYQILVEPAPVVNTDPSVDWIEAWGYPGGPLAPGGEVSSGSIIRLYSQVSDAETPASDLTVTISYRPQGGSWTTEAAAYCATWNFWYYDWSIPGDATPGLYDAKVDVADPQGGSSSSTELGRFKVV